MDRRFVIVSVDGAWVGCGLGDLIRSEMGWFQCRWWMDEPAL